MCELPPSGVYDRRDYFSSPAKTDMIDPNSNLASFRVRLDVLVLDLETANDGLRDAKQHH
jgi:hypothetical protein